MPCSKRRPWQRDSNETASGKPGAVHLFNAVGLAFFAVAGAEKALDFGLSPIMSALLGMLTGIGGGITRDVLLTEIPQVLRSDLYAVAALVAAAVVVVGHVFAVSYGVSALAGGVLCLGLRYMAIKHGWRLPVAHLSARARVETDPPKTRKSAESLVVADSGVLM